MATEAINLPIQGMMAGFRRFSVAEYHKLIQLGILTEDDNLELLEGYLVHKLPRKPPHDGAQPTSAVGGVDVVARDQRRDSRTSGR